jgi:hypothetical protein
MDRSKEGVVPAAVGRAPVMSMQDELAASSAEQILRERLRR